MGGAYFACTEIQGTRFKALDMLQVVHFLVTTVIMKSVPVLGFHMVLLVRGSYRNSVR